MTTPTIKSNRVNWEIKSKRVILIDETGRQLGEFLTRDALQIAESKDLDLMEVNSGETPICKLLDYGKWLYQQKKRHGSGPKKIKTKELQISPVIGENDLNIKVKQARGFLEHGDNVKVTVFFKGRHANHIPLGFSHCAKIIADLSDVARVEQEPKFNSGSILMLLMKK